MRRVGPAVGLLLLVLIGLATLRAVPAPVRTIRVGIAPIYAAIDPRAGRAFVSNYGDGTLTILETARGDVVRRVALGHIPLSMVVDRRTARAFVLNNDDTVTLLASGTGTVVRTIRLRHVYAAAVDERAGYVFVVGGPAGAPGLATMLDARSAAVVRTVPIGTAPTFVAVDTRTHRAFIANHEDDTVSVLDTRTGHVVRTVPVGASPTTVAVDERTGHAFVSNASDASVSMLDTRTGQVLRTVRVGVNPRTLAVARDSGRIFSVNDDSGTVSVLDARTGGVRATVAVGAVRPDCVLYANPSDIVVDEGGGHAYVLNGGTPDRNGKRTAGSVTVLDVRRGRAVHTVAVGLNPLSMAVDEATRHLFVVNNAPATTTDTVQAWAWVPARLRPWLPWLTHPAPVPANGSVSVLDLTQL